MLLSTSCEESAQPRLFKLVDSNDSGIHFQNRLKPTPKLNILQYLYYYNGAGIAVADFNSDGFEDLYFIANQGANTMYLNTFPQTQKLHFRKHTDTLLSDSKGWSTGVTIVDINSDGLPDIYLCKVGGGYRGLEGHNQLLVHQGFDAQGNPRFKEAAASYGLDIQSLATQATFFDYDRDGDLDMYLLNHSVHPIRSYGRGIKRHQIDSLSGDRLYRNDSGVFVDVTPQSGIYQGAIGFGLGIATSDVNDDGYPDIYVANDFFENDYFYLNQKMVLLKKGLVILSIPCHIHLIFLWG